MARSPFLFLSLLVLGTSLVSCATAPDKAVAGLSAQGVQHDPKEPASAPAATPAPPALAAASRACSGRPTTHASCAPKDGCVWDRRGACRDAANACERVAHLTRDYRPDIWPQTPYGRPTFVNGDPCAAVDPRCGFDVGKNLCQPFVALDRCPASAEDARGQRVFCMHPKQPALSCRYKAKVKNKINGGVTFSCRRPPRGPTGRMPPPGSLDTPVGWFEQWDYDDRGCPISTTAIKARCTAPPRQQCRSGLTIFQCIRGRWRRTRSLPPPPSAR